MENLLKNSDNFTKYDSNFIPPILQEIEEKHLSFLQIVEQLKNLLVSPNKEKRELGLFVLNEIIKHFPEQHFNEKELENIYLFYTQRIVDQRVLSEVLKGLLILIETKRISNENIATQILQSIFENVNCQQQEVDDRHAIYKIIRTIFEKFTKTCLEMPNFVPGVLSAITYEGHPKNLVLIFDWWSDFIKSIDLDNEACVAELYSIIECYYPIDYRDESSQNKFITRIELAEKLEKCLCCVQQFASHTIELALNKLDTKLHVAQLDSIKLLARACETFDKSSFQPFLGQISILLMRLYMSTDNAELCTESLHTISRFLSIFSQKNATKNDFISYFAKDTLTEFRNHIRLLDEEKTGKSLLFLPLILKIPSEEIQSHVVDTILRQFVESYKHLEYHPQKFFIHDLITVIYTVLKRENIKNSEFDEFVNTIPQLILNEINNENLRFKVFKSFSNFAPFVQIQIRNAFYSQLEKIIIRNHDIQTENEIKNCLKSFAINFSDEIKCKIVEKIVENNLTIEETKSLYNKLSALVLLEPFTDIILHSLLKLLQSADINLSKAAVGCLQQILENNKCDEQLVNKLVDFDIVGILIKYIINDIKVVSDENKKLHVVESGRLITAFLENVNENVYKDFINKNISIITHSKNNCLFIYVILLKAVLINLKTNDNNCCNLKDIVNELVVISLEKTDNIIRDSACQLIANIFNKQNEDESSSSFLIKVKEICQSKLTENPVNAILLLAWICKALYMKNHQLAVDYSNTLLNLSNDYEIVAEGFDIILNNDLDTLSLKTGCTVNIFYRQKFFTIVTNELIQHYTESKNIYLIMGYLLIHAPEQALQLQSNKIFKLVILSMDHCSVPAALCGILNFIKQTILCKNKVISDYMDEIIERLLNLSVHGPSMKVRMFSLECLQHLSSWHETYKIIRHKKAVLDILGQCLDDKKRIVRKKAVNARCLWFLLDAPV